MLESTVAMRSVTPLRECGSLPGLVEAEDLGTYVVKFRSAGQGPKVLVAEVIVGELARRLGLPVPETKVIEIDEAIGRREPDAEVQQLVVRSAGPNLAIDFLPGALGYDGARSRRRPIWPRASSGSTPSWPTSAAAGAIPTCSCGTATCGRSTTARRCTSTTRGPTHSASPRSPTTPATTCCAALRARAPRPRRGRPW